MLGVEHYQLLLASAMALLCIATLFPRFRGRRSLVRSMTWLFFMSALMWTTFIYVSDFTSPKRPIGITIKRVPTPGQPIIVFIHGWRGSSASWSMFSALLARDVRFNNFGIVHLQFPTSPVRANRTIDDLAQQLETSLMVSSLDGELRFIAHSFGGVLVRTMLTRQGSTLAQRTSHVVTLGSPFDGAPSSLLLAELGLEPTVLDALAPGSPFLMNLTVRWKSFLQSHPASPRLLCVASKGDRIVSYSSATAGCTSVTKFTDWGHVALIQPASLLDDRYTKPIHFLLN